MLKHLRSFPYFCLLLPFFFVLHGYLEHFDFINTSDAAKLALIYCTFSLCVFIFSRLFFNDWRKAALMTFCWIFLYLFFGAIYDFLKLYSPIRLLWRYSFLGSLLIILMLSMFIFLKKTKNKFYTTTFFLNILFIIYITIDLFGIAKKFIQQSEKVKTLYTANTNNFSKIPDSLNKPDIYFLLFDEYASSISLKERFDFNNDIDSFFIAKGFSVQKKSRSNYNYTPFSIASTLNMGYLDWIQPKMGVNRYDFLKCNPLILHNELLRLLRISDYEIVNLSMFELSGSPAKINQSFLPIKTQMISEGTLFPRLYHDFLWFFKRNKFIEWIMEGEGVFRHINNNEFIFTELKETSSQENKKPKFIYAHFFMPHSPYFFDEEGKKQDNPTWMGSPISYLKYVRYTNKRIKELISEILKNTNSQSVIVVLSDHGYRFPTESPNPQSHFQNLNAVYFPDRKYNQLYDSITNVNEFRVILNSLFHLQLPVIADSTVYLIDNK